MHKQYSRCDGVPVWESIRFEIKFSCQVDGNAGIDAELRKSLEQYESIAESPKSVRLAIVD